MLIPLFTVVALASSVVSVLGYNDNLGGYSGSGQIQYTAVEIDPTQLQQLPDYEVQQQQLGFDESGPEQQQQQLVPQTQPQFQKSSIGPSLVNQYVGVRYPQQQQNLGTSFVTVPRSQPQLSQQFNQQLSQIPVASQQQQNLGTSFVTVPRSQPQLSQIPVVSQQQQQYGTSGLARSQSFGLFGENRFRNVVNQNGGNQPQIIQAAVQSRHRLEFRDVPSTRESIAPIHIEVGPSQSPAIELRFNSHSSPLIVRQEHTPSPGSYQESRSVDKPHRLIHTVHRPIYQEINEVIKPYRKVVQQIDPVQEEIQTIVSRSSNDRTASATGSTRRQESITFQSDSSTSGLTKPSVGSVLVNSVDEENQQEEPSSSILRSFGEAVGDASSSSGGYDSSSNSLNTVQSPRKSNNFVQSQTRRLPSRLHFTDDNQSTGTIEVNRIGNGVAYKMMTFTMGRDAINRNGGHAARSQSNYLNTQSIQDQSNNKVGQQADQYNYSLAPAAPARQQLSNYNSGSTSGYKGHLLGQIQTTNYAASDAAA